MTISVLVADDHQVVRVGLHRLFQDSDARIVGEASCTEEVVPLVQRHTPDVVLLDIRMGEEDGFVALERLRDQFPEVRVIMLSTYDNPTYIARAVALGAQDYVLKGAPREQILESVRDVAHGNGPPPGSLLVRIRMEMERRGEKIERDEIPVTNRELQVLRHIALGLSNRDIGRSLGISVETVKEHVQNILRKIHAVDRTQAAVWAIKRGLVRGVVDRPPNS
jgi:DNA-binding NarL/FixJ family response regulator